MNQFYHLIFSEIIKFRHFTARHQRFGVFEMLNQPGLGMPSGGAYQNRRPFIAVLPLGVAAVAAVVRKKDLPLFGQYQIGRASCRERV